VKIRVRYRNNSSEVTAGAARAFRISMTLLAMTAVALLSALITMRLAIHTGEVEVPSLSGLTVEEAADKTSSAQLNLTVENRFYSTTVPAGRVLSQSPSPGASVRKGWHMRITESMGPQRVAIPDTVGLNERDAAMAIRRASLDLGAIAHLPSPGAAEIVLAQTPPANAEGVDKPEVSLLLSQLESASLRAYVMPNLVGMSYTAASAKMREMDLRVYAIVPQPVPVAVDPNAPAGTPPPAPVATIPAGVVLSQNPAAGMRVSAAETARVKMSAAAIAAPASTATPATVPAAPVNGAGAPRPPAPVVRQPAAIPTLVR
jgi:beta-lactam-binding protein with PASTA domain